MKNKALQCARLIGGVLSIIFFLVFFSPHSILAATTLTILVDNVHGTDEEPVSTFDIPADANYLVVQMTNDGSSRQPQLYCVTGGGTGYIYLDSLWSGDHTIEYCSSPATFQFLYEYPISYFTDQYFYVYRITGISDPNSWSMKLHTILGSGGSYTWSAYAITTDLSYFDSEALSVVNSGITWTPYSSTTAPFLFLFGNYKSGSASTLSSWNVSSMDDYDLLQTNIVNRNENAAWSIETNMVDFTISPTPKGSNEVTGLMGVAFSTEAPPVSSSSINDLSISSVDCCTNMSCQIPITFTSALNGAELHVSVDPAVCNPFVSPYDTYTLNYYAGTPQFITLAPQTSGRHYLCAIAGDSEIVNSVDFYASSTNPYCVMQQLPLPQLDCRQYCDAVGAGSSTVDTLLCIGQEVGCYLFQPATSSLTFLTNNFNLLKIKFPANLLFSITDSIESGLTAASTTPNTSIGIPMWSTTTPHHFYMIPVITASSVPETIGVANTLILKLSLIYALYILLACYIVFRLRKK